MSATDKQARVQSLRRCIQEDFYHQTYERYYSTLKALVISKLKSQAGAREVIMFLGPARIGKTRILEALDLEFGQTRHTGSGRSKDVVYVRVPQNS